MVGSADFYNEEIDWVGYVTAQGVRDLAGKDTQLHTGLFIPSLSPAELEEAIQEARENGARGVALFDAGALKPDHLDVIRKLSKQETK